MTLSKANAYRCVDALSCRACPLRHACGVPPLPKGEALAGRKAQKSPLSERQLREGVFFCFGEHHEYSYLLCFYYMPFPAKVKRCTESLQKPPRSGFPFLSVLRFFPDAEQPPEQASQALRAFENDHLHRADHLSSLDTPL